MDEAMQLMSIGSTYILFLFIFIANKLRSRSDFTGPITATEMKLNLWRILNLKLGPDFIIEVG